MGHESSDWDFIHVDEPLPEAMWYAYARGLIDRKGSAWFLCTPITEAWINDYFIPGHRARMDFDDGETFKDEKKRGFWVMTGSSTDNPTNTKDSLEEFARDVSATELEARLHGRPRSLSGIIHREFSHDLHTYSKAPYGWNSPQMPPPEWTIRLAIDPHPKIPMAVLFAATGPHGYTYFFAELFMKMFIPGLCEMIKSTLTDVTPQGRVQRPIMTALCDPLAWTPNPINGQTMANEFIMNDVLVQPGSKALSDGILRSGEILRQRDAEGNPMIYFHESLHRTLFEFDRYIWDPKSEKPLDNNNDHMMENFHRLCLAGLSYLNPMKQATVIRPMEMSSRPDFTLPSYDSGVKKPKRNRYPN
jgi:hypothetical protein